MIYVETEGQICYITYLVTFTITLTKKVRLVLMQKLVFIAVSQHLTADKYTYTTVAFLFHSVHVSGPSMDLCAYEQ